MKWGILGAGNIAHRFAKSLENDTDSSIVAISVRDPKKGQKFSEEFSVDKIYTHDDLLKDPEVEAIYLALPHHLHSEWTKKALNNGKPVLCEKPSTLNLKELKEVIKTAQKNKVLFMEAMKPRFMKAYKLLLELISQDVIGEIEEIKTTFATDSHFDENNKTYHTSEIDGGSLLDVGSYGASLLVNLLYKDSLKNSIKVIEKEERLVNGNDFYTKAIIDFDGSKGIIETGFDRDLGKKAIIKGTKGKIIINNFHRPQSLVVITENGKKEYSFIEDDFYPQVKYFEKLVEEGAVESDIISYEDSLKIMELIDLIKNYNE